MYIIEMHHAKRAFSQVVLEKGDSTKTYDDFAQYRLIINHSGDIDPAKCPWCALNRRAALLKERRKANAVVSNIYSSDTKR